MPYRPCITWCRGGESASSKHPSGTTHRVARSDPYITRRRGGKAGDMVCRPYITFVHHLV